MTSISLASLEAFSFRRKKIRPSAIPAAIAKKWSPSVLDEGFTPFPKRLLRSMTRIFTGPTGIEDLALVLAVADYKRLNLQRLPSIEYLAWNAGLSLERFQERLHDLVSRQLVSRKGTDQDLDISLALLEEAIESLTPEDRTTVRGEDDKK